MWVYERSKIMKKFLVILMTAVLMAASLPIAVFAAPTEGWYNGHYCYWNGSKYYYVGNDGCTYICDPQPDWNNNDRKDHKNDCNWNYNNWNYWNNNCNWNNNNNYNNGFNNYNFYGGVLDVYDGSTEDQAVVLARIINIYAHGVASQTAQAGVGWAVMNSVDASGKGASVCTVAGNFGYDYNGNLTDDFGRSLLPLARDIIFRWKAGRSGIASNGRVVPGGYYYVTSTGNMIAITTGPNGSGGVWNFSYKTPYAS